MKRKVLFGAILTTLCIMFAPRAMALDVDNFQALQDAVNGNEKNITLTADVNGNLVVPAGSEISLDGGNKTLTGTIKFEATIVGEKTKTIFELKNLVLDGNNTANIGIVSQNQATDPVKLYLIMDNVTVKNFKGKGTYFTNVQELYVTKSNFNNNATTTQTSVVGDYAFDINLIGIQDAIIAIENSTFGGVSGGNSPIKVTQRGGVDDIMKDIPYYRDSNGANPTGKAPASIAYLSINNNDFTSVTGNKKGDVIIGSSPNADGSARTSATEFSYEVVAKTGTETGVYIRSTATEEADVDNYKATAVTDTTPLRNNMVAVTIYMEGHSEVIHVPVGYKFTDEEINELKNIKVDGYNLIGYFEDAEFKTEFDFTKTIEANTEIHVKLEKIVDQPVIENPSTGDINFIPLIAIAIIGIVGISYSLRLKLKTVRK